MAPRSLWGGQKKGQVPGSPRRAAPLRQSPPRAPAPGHGAGENSGCPGSGPPATLHTGDRGPGAETKLLPWQQQKQAAHVEQVSPRASRVLAGGVQAAEQSGEARATGRGHPGMQETGVPGGLPRLGQQEPAQRDHSLPVPLLRETGPC